MTYRIAKPKVRRRVRAGAAFNPIETHGSVKLYNDADLQKILDANLSKCFMKEGDKVKFKKPKRNPVYGTIVKIQDKLSEVTWSSAGAVPMNVIVEVDKVDPETRIVYGKERVKTNVKKLVFCGVFK